MCRSFIRQETEYLVSLLRQQISDGSTIIDLGCGSGVIGLSLAAAFPNARVTLVDISREALELTRENAAHMGVAERVHIHQSDWWRDIPNTETFDWIISNPPYVARNDEVESGVRRFEPALALDSGEDGTDDLFAILQQLDRRLAPGGQAWFELGHNHANQLNETLKQIFDVSWHPDPWGVVRYLQIQKGSSHSWPNS